VVALSAGGTRRVVARARPDAMVRDMLVFDADPADGPEAALAVGPSCRICAHRGCRQRREPSVIQT
jgi:predicted transcriptional regulator